MERWNRLKRMGVVISVGTVLVILASCRQEEPPRNDKTSQADQSPTAATTTPAPTPTAVSQDNTLPPQPVAPVPTDTPTPVTSASTPTVAKRTGKGRRLHFKLNDDIEKTFRELLERWSRIESIKSKMTMTYEQQFGLKQNRHGEGTYILKKKEGKSWIHMENYESMIVERAKDDRVMTGEAMIRLYDGEFLYTLRALHNSKKAYKTRPRLSTIQFLGGPKLIIQLRLLDTLTLKLNGALDDKNVYLFHGTRQEDQVETDFYIDKKTGILRKIHTISKAKDRPYSLTLNFTDIKVNVEVSEDDLAFNLPDGVELEDLTQAKSDSSSPPTPVTP